MKQLSSFKPLAMAAILLMIVLAACGGQTAHDPTAVPVEPTAAPVEQAEEPTAEPVAEPTAEEAATDEAVVPNVCPTQRGPAEAAVW